MDAEAALPVRQDEEPRHPLRLAENSAFFKLFMNDVGLLTCEYGMEAVRGTLGANPCVNYGAIYESAAAQELRCRHEQLWYHCKKKMGELDFVLDTRRGALPVEVKSGKDCLRHSALDNALRTSGWGIERAVVLHEGNVSGDDPVNYLPVYIASLL